jgi:hypothetical protein
MLPMAGHVLLLCTISGYATGWSDAFCQALYIEIGCFYRPNVKMFGDFRSGEWWERLYGSFNSSG